MQGNKHMQQMLSNKSSRNMQLLFSQSLTARKLTIFSLWENHIPVGHPGYS